MIRVVSLVPSITEALCMLGLHYSVIFDRDARYGLEVPAAVRSLRVNPIRSSFESPWQNGVAERWVGSCRRDLLDHIIAIDELSSTQRKKLRSNGLLRLAGSLTM